MVHDQAARLEQAAQLGEIPLQLRAADVLEHADRGNLVVGDGFVELAVVQQRHADAACQALLLDQAADVRVLVARQRNAGGIDAIVLGGPEQQPAPPCAHVQEAFAVPQAQFAADVVQLGLLGLGQRHAGLAEVGAGVHPARVQPKRVEIVGQVVMEFDLLRVALHRVPPDRHDLADQLG
ncbi:hypothetical protein D9M70_532540 [compost metagenome]